MWHLKNLGVNIIRRNAVSGVRSLKGAVVIETNRNHRLCHRARPTPYTPHREVKSAEALEMKTLTNSRDAGMVRKNLKLKHLDPDDVHWKTKKYLRERGRLLHGVIYQSNDFVVNRKLGRI